VLSAGAFGPEVGPSDRSVLEWTWCLQEIPHSLGDFQICDSVCVSVSTVVKHRLSMSAGM
jgi:hypothetical protein